MELDKGSKIANDLICNWPLQCINTIRQHHNKPAVIKLEVNTYNVAVHLFYHIHLLIITV